MMTPGNFPDSYNETKLPAVTGKAMPFKKRPVVHAGLAPMKKKAKPPKAMHAKMAAAMENC